MRILCIGDSNTWGYNPVNGRRFEKRWPKILGEMMPDSEIIEEGLCGRTVISRDDEQPERCGQPADAADVPCAGGSGDCYAGNQ